MTVDNRIIEKGVGASNRRSGSTLHPKYDCKGKTEGKRRSFRQSCVSLPTLLLIYLPDLPFVESLQQILWQCYLSQNHGVSSRTAETNEECYQAGGKACLSLDSRADSDSFVPISWQYPDLIYGFYQRHLIPVVWDSWCLKLINKLLEGKKRWKRKSIWISLTFFNSKTIRYSIRTSSLVSESWQLAVAVWTRG